MSNFIKDCLHAAESLGIAFQENVPMSAKTSFKIGGIAELILLPADDNEVLTCVQICAERYQKPFVLGNGSNLLVKDSGIENVVISTEKLQKKALAGPALIYCESGLKLSELCVFAQKHGLSGLEFAYGIPGSAGGAAYMNAGAYGGEMKDVLHSIRYVDSDGVLREMPAREANLSYRHSVFMANGGIIVGITVQLSSNEPTIIQEKMQDIMRRRREKQPLEYPSAGSVFKRPEGHFAGGLIEQCGLKGKAVGGAQISMKHAGFIINTGGATAADVRALIALTQAIVEQETGVFLVPEIKFV